MRTALTAATILALAAPALAAGPRAEAVFWGFALFPCLALLLALPAAVAIRAASGAPLRIERKSAGPGHVPRLVGSLAIAAMVVLLSGARRHEAGGWLLLLFAVVLLAGLSVAAVRLGRSLFADPGRGESTGAFALGWLVLAGLSLLPVLGTLLLLWFGSFGLGALILSPFRKGAAA